MKNIIWISIVTSTAIFSANVANVNIDNSENSIENITVHRSDVSQGKMEVLGESSMKNITIRNSNSIENSSIENSQVSQATISISGKSEVSESDAHNVDIQSTNVIKDNTDIKFNSVVKQSTLNVSGDGTSISNLTIGHNNMIIGSNLITESSNVGQAELNISGGSQVDNIIHNITDTIRDSEISGSVVQQAVVDIADGSLVKNVDIDGINNMIGVKVNTNSSVLQNVIDISNSDVENLTIRQSNTISKSDINTWSRVSQGEMIIGSK